MSSRQVVSVDQQEANRRAFTDFLHIVTRLQSTHIAGTLILVVWVWGPLCCFGLQTTIRHKRYKQQQEVVSYTTQLPAWPELDYDSLRFAVQLISLSNDSNRYIKYQTRLSQYHITYTTPASQSSHNNSNHGIQ